MDQLRFAQFAFGPEPERLVAIKVALADERFQRELFMGGQTLKARGCLQLRESAAESVRKGTEFIVLRMLVGPVVDEQAHESLRPEPGTADCLESCGLVKAHEQLSGSHHGSAVDHCAVAPLAGESPHRPEVVLHE